MFNTLQPISGFSITIMCNENITNFIKTGSTSVQTQKIMIKRQFYKL